MDKKRESKVQEGSEVSVLHDGGAACITMEKKYGCTFLFCSPEEAAERIIELLTKGEDGYKDEESNK